ncbi:hypothetical protein C2857_005190 [Epichloe festucae Fl1]|uniref:Uncharacterized protein n=1 Tax=Epichloe festucae (strain Fl1) TaxID=877507 RepID=A0A7S9KSP9_EPIFF|nr:hypothetical protein C2857_005190 [Epichloe festucae Fl1]
MQTSDALEKTKGRGQSTDTLHAYCMGSTPGRALRRWRRLPILGESPRRSHCNASASTPPGFTLDSLHGLAASLNPGALEATSVQAWFELSSWAAMFWAGCNRSWW